MIGKTTNQESQLQSKPKEQLQQQSQKVSPGDESGSEEQYLENLETAINQLRKIVENPSSTTRMNESQSSQQLQVLLEKYEKIEQMVMQEQDQITQLVNTHLQFQQELSNEYVAHQQIIIQGKHDILQLSLVNKQALQYQDKGQKALQVKQKEAESLMKDISQLQNELKNTNQIILEKKATEKAIDQQNMRFAATIEEFQKDQGEQKDGLDDYKVKIQNGEREIKMVKKEQLDMQKKIEHLKKTSIEIKSQITQYESSREVATSELKNEKRTLALNDRKLEEILSGLQRIETEIQKSNEHLAQIRQVNETLKRRAHLIQSSMLVRQPTGPDAEELSTLENLLEQYNNLVLDKQKIITAKEEEKGLLEEHLTQLNIFAQQYIQKQQQQEQQQLEYQQQQYYQMTQQQQNANNNNNNAGVSDARIRQIQGNGQNSDFGGNQNQKYNMESIQSQYEQEEQDQQIHPNQTQFNAKQQQQQQAQTISQQNPSQNFQIYLEPKPIGDINQQSIQEENSLTTFQQQQSQDRQQNFYENGTQNSSQKRVDNNTHSSNAQLHMDTPSESDMLNVEKYSYQEEANNEGRAQQEYHKYDPTGSFGNQQMESPNEAQSNFNNNINAEQQLIANGQSNNGFTQGGLPANQQQEFTQEQGEEDDDGDRRQPMYKAHQQS